MLFGLTCPRIPRNPDWLSFKRVLKMTPLLENFLSIAANRSREVTRDGAKMDFCRAYRRLCAVRDSYTDCVLGNRSSCSGSQGKARTSRSPEGRKQRGPCRSWGGLTRCRSESIPTGDSGTGAGGAAACACRPSRSSSRAGTGEPPFAAGSSPAGTRTPASRTSDGDIRSSCARTTCCLSTDSCLCTAGCFPTGACGPPCARPLAQAGGGCDPGDIRSAR